MVLSQAQQNRIVKNAPVPVGYQYVFALTNSALTKVSRCQHLNELRCVWPRNFYLTLNSHVTQDGIVYQIPKILLRVAKVSRNVHMVVDGKTLRTPPHCGVKVRGLADLSAETKFSLLC